MMEISRVVWISIEAVIEVGTEFHGIDESAFACGIERDAPRFECGADSHDRQHPEGSAGLSGKEQMGVSTEGRCCSRDSQPTGFRVMRGSLGDGFFHRYRDSRTHHKMQRMISLGHLQRTGIRSLQPMLTNKWVEPHCRRR